MLRTAHRTTPRALAVMFLGFSLVACDAGRSAFSAAASQDTPEAYQGFLAQHPQHSLADSARRLLDAAETRIAAELRRQAYKCAGGMKAGMFMLLPPGSTNITFGVSPQSDKDSAGPYGHVCALKIRENATVVLVEGDGTLQMDREGLVAVEEGTNAAFVTKRIAKDPKSPIFFVPKR
jgi:hypothetical protein